nr:hypothetical protein [Corynebacterium mendelii]
MQKIPRDRSTGDRGSAAGGYISPPAVSLNEEKIVSSPKNIDAGSLGKRLLCLLTAAVVAVAGMVTGIVPGAGALMPRAHAASSFADSNGSGLKLVLGEGGQTYGQIYWIDWTALNEGNLLQRLTDNEVVSLEFNFGNAATLTADLDFKESTQLEGKTTRGGAKPLKGAHPHLYGGFGAPQIITDNRNAQPWAYRYPNRKKLYPDPSYTDAGPLNYYYKTPEGTAVALGFDPKVDYSPDYSLNVNLKNINVRSSGGGGQDYTVVFSDAEQFSDKKKDEFGIEVGENDPYKPYKFGLLKTANATPENKKVTALDDVSCGGFGERKVTCRVSPQGRPAPAAVMLAAFKPTSFRAFMKGDKPNNMAIGFVLPFSSGTTIVDHVDAATGREVDEKTEFDLSIKASRDDEAETFGVTDGPGKPVVGTRESLQVSNEPITWKSSARKPIHKNYYPEWTCHAYSYPTDPAVVTADKLGQFTEREVVVSEERDFGDDAYSSTVQIVKDPSVAYYSCDVVWHAFELKPPSLEKITSGEKDTGIKVSGIGDYAEKVTVTVDDKQVVLTRADDGWMTPDGDFRVTTNEDGTVELEIVESARKKYDKKVFKATQDRFIDNRDLTSDDSNEVVLDTVPDNQISVVDPAITPVLDPQRLTDAEKAAVKKAIEDANAGNFPPETTVKVGDKGKVTITYPDDTRNELAPEKTITPIPLATPTVPETPAAGTREIEIGRGDGTPYRKGDKVTLTITDADGKNPRTIEKDISETDVVNGKVVIQVTDNDGKPLQPGQRIQAKNERGSLGATNSDVGVVPHMPTPVLKQPEVGDTVAKIAKPAEGTPEYKAGDSITITVTNEDGKEVAVTLPNLSTAQAEKANRGELTISLVDDDGEPFVVSPSATMTVSAQRSETTKKGENKITKPLARPVVPEVTSGAEDGKGLPIRITPEQGKKFRPGDVVEIFVTKPDGDGAVKVQHTITEDEEGGFDFVPLKPLEPETTVKADNTRANGNIRKEGKEEIVPALVKPQITNPDFGEKRSVILSKANGSPDFVAGDTIEITTPLFDDEGQPIVEDGVPVHGVLGEIALTAENAKAANEGGVKMEIGDIFPGQTITVLAVRASTLSIGKSQTAPDLAAPHVEPIKAGQTSVKIRPEDNEHAPYREGDIVKITETIPSNDPDAESGNKPRYHTITKAEADKGFFTYTPEKPFEPGSKVSVFNSRHQLYRDGNTVEVLALSAPVLAPIDFGKDVNVTVRPVADSEKYQTGDSITVTVVDAEGNPVKDDNGQPRKETIKITDENRKAANDADKGLTFKFGEIKPGETLRVSNTRGTRETTGNDRTAPKLATPVIVSAKAGDTAVEVNDTTNDKVFYRLGDEVTIVVEKANKEKVTYSHTIDKNDIAERIDHNTFTFELKDKEGNPVKLEPGDTLVPTNKANDFEAQGDRVKIPDLTTPHIADVEVGDEATTVAREEGAPKFVAGDEIAVTVTYPDGTKDTFTRTLKTAQEIEAANDPSRGVTVPVDKLGPEATVKVSVSRNGTQSKDGNSVETKPLFAPKLAQPSAGDTAVRVKPAADKPFREGDELEFTIGDRTITHEISKKGLEKTDPDGFFPVELVDGENVIMLAPGDTITVKNTRKGFFTEADSKSIAELAVPHINDIEVGDKSVTVTKADGSPDYVKNDIIEIVKADENGKPVPDGEGFPVVVALKRLENDDEVKRANSGSGITIDVEKLAPDTHLFVETTRGPAINEGNRVSTKPLAAPVVQQPAAGDRFVRIGRTGDTPYRAGDVVKVKVNGKQTIEHEVSATDIAGFATNGFFELNLPEDQVLSPDDKVTVTNNRSGFTGGSDEKRIPALVNPVIDPIEVGTQTVTVKKADQSPDYVIDDVIRVAKLDAEGNPVVIDGKEVVFEKKITNQAEADQANSPKGITVDVNGIGPNTVLEVAATRGGATNTNNRVATQPLAAPDVPAVKAGTGPIAITPVKDDEGNVVAPFRENDVIEVTFSYPASDNGKPRTETVPHTVTKEEAESGIVEVTPNTGLEPGSTVRATNTRLGGTYESASDVETVAPLAVPAVTRPDFGENQSVTVGKAPNSPDFVEGDIVRVTVKGVAGQPDRVEERTLTGADVQAANDGTFVVELDKIAPEQKISVTATRGTSTKGGNEAVAPGLATPVVPELTAGNDVTITAHPTADFREGDVVTVTVTNPDKSVQTIEHTITAEEAKANAFTLEQGEGTDRINTPLAAGSKVQATNRRSGFERIGKEQSLEPLTTPVINQPEVNDRQLVVGRKPDAPAYVAGDKIVVTVGGQTYEKTLESPADIDAANNATLTIPLDKAVAPGDTATVRVTRDGSTNKGDDQLVPKLAAPAIEGAVEAGQRRVPVVVNDTIEFRQGDVIKVTVTDKDGGKVVEEHEVTAEEAAAGRLTVMLDRALQPEDTVSVDNTRGDDFSTGGNSAVVPKPKPLAEPVIAVPISKGDKSVLLTPADKLNAPFQPGDVIRVTIGDKSYEHEVTPDEARTGSVVITPEIPLAAGDTVAPVNTRAGMDEVPGQPESVPYPLAQPLITSSPLVDDNEIVVTPVDPEIAFREGDVLVITVNETPVEHVISEQEAKTGEVALTTGTSFADGDVISVTNTRGDDSVRGNTVTVQGKKAIPPIAVPKIITDPGVDTTELTVQPAKDNFIEGEIITVTIDGKAYEHTVTAEDAESGVVTVTVDPMKPGQRASVSNTRQGFAPVNGNDVTVDVPLARPLITTVPVDGTDAVTITPVEGEQFVAGDTLVITQSNGDPINHVITAEEAADGSVYVETSELTYGDTVTVANTRGEGNTEDTKRLGNTVTVAYPPLARPVITTDPVAGTQQLSVETAPGQRLLKGDLITITIGDKKYGHEVTEQDVKKAAIVIDVAAMSPGQMATVTNSRGEQTIGGNKVEVPVQPLATPYITTTVTEGTSVLTVVPADDKPFVAGDTLTVIVGDTTHTHVVSLEEADADSATIPIDPMEPGDSATVTNSRDGLAETEGNTVSVPKQIPLATPKIVTDPVIDTSELEVVPDGDEPFNAGDTIVITIGDKRYIHVVTGAEAEAGSVRIGVDPMAAEQTAVVFNSRPGVPQVDGNQVSTPKPEPLPLAKPKIVTDVKNGTAKLEIVPADSAVPFVVGDVLTITAQGHVFTHIVTAAEAAVNSVVFALPQGMTAGDKASVINSRADKVVDGNEVEVPVEKPEPKPAPKREESSSAGSVLPWLIGVPLVGGGIAWMAQQFGHQAPAPAPVAPETAPAPEAPAKGIVKDAPIDRDKPVTGILAQTGANVLGLGIIALLMVIVGALLIIRRRTSTDGV